MSILGYPWEPEHIYISVICYTYLDLHLLKQEPQILKKIYIDSLQNKNGSQHANISISE